MKKLLNNIWQIYHKYEEILNYLIVGAIGVVISVVSYALSRWIGFNIVTSNIISWIIAVLCMYIMNKLFVFKTKLENKKALFKEFISFITARVFTLIVETLILYFGTNLLHINDLFVKVIAQIVIIILNYILSKLIIFNKNKNPNSKKKILNRFNFLLDKKVFLISSIIWLIYFITGIQDRFFINNNLSFKSILPYKILQFILFYFFGLIVKKIISNRKDIKCKHGIIIGTVFAIIMFILLLTMWPGTWSWDDAITLRHAQTYTIYPWQHFICSLFYIVSLETFPFMSGVIIMRIIIISIIMGYSISNIVDIFKKTEKQRITYEIFLLIPSLFPPVIMYTLSGYRMGIYSFIELLLIVQLIIIFYKKKKLTIGNFIGLAFTIILVASWRTEGIYYIPCVALILLFLNKKIIPRKQILTLFIITLSFTMIINKVNTSLIANDNYSITAIVEPLQALIKKADPNEDKSTLQQISRVIDIDYIYNNPNLHGEQLYWSHKLVKPNYSKDDFKALFKSYIKLTLKYPLTSIKAMTKMYLKSSGIILKKDGTVYQKTNISQALTLYNDDNTAWSSIRNIKSSFKKASSIRNQTMLLLRGFNNDNKPNIIHYIFWNLNIPILLLSLCFIYKLFKKDWFFSSIIFVVMLRIPLVFITSPAPYYMYYHSVYLITYIIVFLILIEAIFNSKNKKDNLK